MSFTNAPVTRTIVSGVILSSVLGSLLDLKHYLYILTDLHIWQYHQLWRVFVFQLGYTNSSEALFGAMAFYHMRTIERLWGSRKYASFLVTSYLLTSLAVPTLLTLLISPLTAQKMTYLPAGPTPTLFAVLAQYHAIVPYIYQYRLVFPVNNNNPQREQQQQSQPQSPQTELKALTFSDKSYKYILALQPLLFQFPASIPGAFAGWVLGHAHRYELFPPGLTHWRLPTWLVGHKPRARGGGDGFEGLQRRLEGESAAATTATGASTGILASEGVGGGGTGTGAGAAGGRRRNWGQQILDQFRVVL